MASREFLDRLSKLSQKQLALLAIELQDKIERLTKPAAAPPIAIVGMSCRFPGEANSPEAYWQLLAGGVDAIGEVPPERWDVNALYDPDPDAPGKIATRFGGFLSDLAGFDADFFGITPREAASMDPQQRLVLEVAWEALERAGYSPDGLERTRTGVFVGICNTDYFQINYGNDPQRIDAYLASGSASSIASGRLSYLLGLQGPSVSIDTACSSSLIAIHLACQSLRAGECTMAIAGGVNVILRPEVSMTLSRAHMLAPDGRCKAFDSRANGFVRSEGCGLLVLKPLAEAQAAGDHVLAVIRGSAANQDGRSSGITAPNGPSQEAVIRDALTMAGLRPADMGYVEAHGTGTSLGDPIEIQALHAALGSDRAPDAPLLVGSVKTNIGHLESAAGVAGLMKVVLSLGHRMIPPHLHLRERNTHVDWARLNVAIPTALTPWPAYARPVAGVSSLGFSGTNAHIILEEAPAQAAVTAAQPRHRPLLLPLAAKSELALKQLAQRYAAHLAEHASESLADTCYTAAVGRAHFSHRLAVLGTDRASLIGRLQRFGADEEFSGIARGHAPTPPDVAFLFSGQGSQYVGMGRDLYAAEPVFRRVIDECDQALASLLPKPLTKLLFESERAELEQTAHLQPALFALEVALAALWKSWGVTPSIVAGHSLGEFSAACVAGVFDVATGAKLVAMRGRLMQSVRGYGRMAAVMADEATVRRAINSRARDVSIAAINGPTQTVISGYASAVDELSRELSNTGVRVQPLDVSHAFHSPQMEEMLAEFESEARRYTYRAPRIDIVSNVTGKLWGAAEIGDPAGYWCRHARAPVAFTVMMSTLAEHGCRTFVEIGPNPVLLGLARQCIAPDDALWLPSLKHDRAESEQLADTVSRLYCAGVRIDWHGFYGPEKRRRVVLPTYPFQRRRYWAAAPAIISIESRKAPAPQTDWLYEIEWQRSLHANVGESAARDTWLILADPDGVGAGLAAKLRERGDPCVVVPYSASVDFDSLLAQAPSRIVHLWSLGREDGAPTAASLRDAQVRNCGSVLRLVQALARRESSNSPQLSIVTRGAVVAGEPTRAAISAAPLVGLAKVVALEQPQLRCEVIDLDPEQWNATALCTELVQADRESLVALRAGTRLVPRLTHSKSGAGSAVDTTAIAANATYLVTGGLGGLGLEVARSFVAAGARHLVLLGRSAPSERARKALDEMAAEGARVQVEAVDVGDRAALERLFTSISETMPPLAGIVHAAGVLDDGVLSQQSWDRFERVFRPKIDGAWNLHELSADLPLRFFVLFSSVAALMGSPGQGNYTAANAFLDALAHYRRARGLAAVSIAWGGWGETGMAATLDARQRERHARQGVEMLETAAALSLLRALLQGAPANVGVFAMDWGKVVAQYEPGHAPPLLDLLREGGAPKKSGTTWRLDEVPAADRIETLTDLVRAEVARVIGLGDPSEVDTSRGLFELGMDSLMAVELRTSLEKRAGRPLSATLTFNYPNVTALAGFFEKLLFGQAEPRAAAAPAPAPPAEVPVTPREELSEEHLERLLAEKLKTL
jgi:malonyl CoA-acyl carrier protein transacylase